MNDDREWMKQAISIARKGVGKVSPNPLVGCVIIKDGALIGEGAHEYYGGPHAEANALENVEALGNNARGATAYVTLEPCNHHGRTSPCSDRLIAAGISKCVIAAEDPNPIVAGGGADKLRAAGIEVEIGVMEAEARDLARFFFKSITTGIPFVTLKIAQSLDGKSALKSGKSQWITSEAARTLVHQMRLEHDAVMVGSNTVLADDPSLNVRLVDGRNPTRIVLDGHLRVPITAKIFSGDTKRIVATLEESLVQRVAHAKQLQDLGVVIVAVRSIHHAGTHVDLHALFQDLCAHVSSILFEAGPTMTRSLLAGHHADELVVLQAPVILGTEWVSSFGETGSNPKIAFELIESTKIADSSDCFLRYRVT